jgi:integrase
LQQHRRATLRGESLQFFPGQVVGCDVRRAACVPRNFARHFALRSTKAGVCYIKVHDIRRTCGSLLAALAVHPRVVMQILRHTKIGIMMEFYTEVRYPRTRDAVRRLGDQLDG